MRWHRRSGTAVLRLLCAGAAIFVACGVPKEYAKSWEGLHRAKFLPGYVDYRGEADGTEEGYVIMSFGLPDAVTPENTIAATIAHFGHAFPCYKLIEQAPMFVVLRCPGGRQRDGGMLDEEYQFLVRREARRVFVLALDRAQRRDYDTLRPLLQQYAER